MIATTARPWATYVAIGDSFTEGLSDEDPERPGRFRGWADRLAEHLAPHAEGFAYANLAVRGRLLDDVVGPQLQAALALEPDLVSMVAGGNNLLRPTIDLDAVAERLEDAVVAIRSRGVDVLLATAADMSGAPVLRHIRGRAGIWNAFVWGIAARQGCYVLDMFGQRYLRDWRMWGVDRIHLSPVGHERVSLAAYQALGHATPDQAWSVPLEAEPPLTRRDAVAGNVRWAREYAGPWVGRRLRGTSSGDTRTAKLPDASPWPPATGGSTGARTDDVDA